MRSLVTLFQAKSGDKVLPADDTGPLALKSGHPADSNVSGGPPRFGLGWARWTWLGSLTGQVSQTNQSCRSASPLFYPCTPT